MRRREFITWLGGATTALAIGPFAVRAQQAGKIPTIGFLGSGTSSAANQWVAAFVQRLRELGWVEGRSITIEYWWTEGRVEHSAVIAAEAVRLKVDVIVAAGTAVAVAAKQATSAIPIVFPIAGDPVEIGLVASLARPGGNATGLSMQKSDIASKRLELLREGIPGFRRVAILANVAYPAALLEMREVQVAARTLGLDAVTSEIRSVDDIAAAFDAINGRVDALYVCADPLVFTNRIRIATLALGARLPSIYDNQEFVQAGGQMSYGPNFLDLLRRGAEFVDKILRGAKPADLPVEQPTRFDLVINLTTAKALGLTIPPTLLARANEVIE